MVTYNPGTPQPPDIPADSQDEFVSNFGLLNQYFGVDHVPFGTTVFFATNANPCVCTAPNHGMTSGNTVNITHFGSLVGDVIQPWNINGGPYTVTVIDANTFSMNVDASSNPTYLANTGAFSCLQFNYGFHTKTYFPTTQPQGPNTNPPLGSPYSAYYSKTQANVAQFFFQNSVGGNFEKQMTELDFVEISNANGKGIITPWGVKINMGQIAWQPTSQTYTYPVPFTSAVWSIIGTLQIKTTKFVRPFWQMNAVGLSTFTALARTDAEAPATNIPGWYFAIGV